MRKAKHLGITRQVQQNDALRAHLRKHYALALLPADRIVDAFNSLQVLLITNFSYLFKEYFFY